MHPTSRSFAADSLTSPSCTPAPARQDIEHAETADVAFALGLSKEAIARAARLKWVHCSGHAVGHFPLAELAARAITVTNSRGVQAIPIAEHVWRACWRWRGRLPQTMRDQQQSLWRPNELLGDASPWLLSGRTLAVIGMGTIGQAIAVRARAFGMRIVGMRRNPNRGSTGGVRPGARAR
jgi:phosphoglycerate dehydrogenase-like enzyme